MYHIHRTLAIVAKLKPSGEADMLVTLCTRDYGVVLAIAKGLRRETSKLRYVVQELKYVYVELVRGKEYWRMTSVQPVLENDPNYKIPLNKKESIKTIARMVDLWRRLGGEDPLPQVFDDIRLAENFLEEKGDSLIIESLVVSRLLASLGYIDTRANSIIYDKEICQESIDYVEKNLQIIIQDINKAISASHL